jgi:hypothetical protein
VPHRTLRWLTVIRYICFIAVVAAWLHFRSTPLQAFHWNECDEYCPTAGCSDTCFVDQMEFDNGNRISCLDYGVFDTSQFCCGDGLCNGDAGEDSGSCSADCGPGGSGTVSGSNVLLVNGSFDSDPPWVQPGAPERVAIGNTYGVDPTPWPWMNNSTFEVLPPAYLGILEGGCDLVDYVNSTVPDGPVDIIAHSHGGNVAIFATYCGLARPITHLINLATPINFDLPRGLAGYGAYSRCQASSWSDWTQFGGSSPTQISNWAFDVYEAADYSYQAVQAMIDGDWDTCYYDTALSAWYGADAYWWWSSTKIELEGPTWGFNGLEHSDMHEPPVWYAIAWACAVN